MKSKFAKFIDSTVGAALLFAVFTAIFRYYTTAELAAFSAAAATACALFMLGFIGKKRAGAVRLSSRSEGMFYDFMFEDDGLPAKLMCGALKKRGLNAAVRGKAVYAGRTAAFFRFDAPPDSRYAARAVAKAKRYGAQRIVIFSRSPAASTVSVDGFTITAAHGDDVYRLFASLGALPRHKYEKPRAARFAALRGALGRDKIARYLVLAAALFAISAITRHRIVTLSCAAISAALFAASAIYNIVKAAKRKSPADA